MHLMKIALISNTLPPSRSGQAIVLERILTQLDPASYHLISPRKYTYTADESVFGLSGNYHYLPPEPQITEFYFVEYIRKINFFLASLLRGRRIARILKRTGCQVAIACSGDIVNLPATWLAARWAGIPFIPYLFDDYTYQWPAGPHRDMATFFERFIFSHPAGVICPSEMLAQEIKRRHGQQAHIVRNPTGRPTLPSAPVEPERQDDLPRIVFTGSAYHMNFGTFRDVLAALAIPGSPQAVLELYTQLSPEELAREGISGPNLSVRAQVPSSQVYSVQSGADVLLLPYAFDTLTPEIPLTAAPGKLGDYLASGRPILAQAPEGSFTAWYLNTYDCGTVISQPGPEPIARALGQLLNRPETARRLAANGLARARAEFTAAAATANFLAVLGGNK